MIGFKHYKSDFCNYADDTTPYNFSNNFKANASKCNLYHFLVQIPFILHVL